MVNVTLIHNAFKGYDRKIVEIDSMTIIELEELSIVRNLDSVGGKLDDYSFELTHNNIFEYELIHNIENKLKSYEFDVCHNTMYEFTLIGVGQSIPRTLEEVRQIPLSVLRTMTLDEVRYKSESPPNYDFTIVKEI